MLIIDTQKGNNNKHSGGLPHSEIHGSKLILSSPWLIAEYHVFHRLLLPRHSPNALLALDLIQKKTGFFCTRQAFCVLAGIDQKHTFPLLPMSWKELVRWLIARVSVLDLDNSVLFSPADRGSVEETT